MSAELVHLVTLAMRHPTLGVNAQLRATPGLGAHPVPPAVARVYSIGEDDAVASGQVLNATPFLMVQDVPDYVLDGEVSNAAREGTVTISVAYGTTDTAAAARGYTHASQTLRAALRATADALLDAALLAAQHEHGVLVLTCTGATIRLLGEKVGHALITGELLLTFRTRDVAPTRAQALTLTPG